MQTFRAVVVAVVLSMTTTTCMGVNQKTPQQRTQHISKAPEPIAPTDAGVPLDAQTGVKVLLSSDAGNSSWTQASITAAEVVVVPLQGIPLRVSNQTTTLDVQ